MVLFHCLAVLASGKSFSAVGSSVYHKSVQVEQKKTHSSMLGTALYILDRKNAPKQCHNEGWIARKEQADQQR